MTTNNQLCDMAEKLKIPNFRGVFMKDQLKTMTPNENEGLIINFESSNQSGSHWVASYKNGNDKYYFDSYGADILPELKTYMCSPIKCHNFQIQEFNSGICGELCLLFLFLMNKGMSYENVILSMF